MFSNFSEKLRLTHCGEQYLFYDKFYNIQIERTPEKVVILNKASKCPSKLKIY